MSKLSDSDLPNDLSGLTESGDPFDENIIVESAYVDAIFT